MGWTYWAYKHWDDPTTADDSQGLFTDDADLSTVKMDKLRQLVRTYPQATAGTPTNISYDATTGLFSMTYTPKLVHQAAHADLRQPAHLAARVRRAGDRRNRDEERLDGAREGHLGQDGQGARSRPR